MKNATGNTTEFSNFFFVTSLLQKETDFVSSHENFSKIQSSEISPVAS